MATILMEINDLIDKNRYYVLSLVSQITVTPLKICVT